MEFNLHKFRIREGKTDEFLEKLAKVHADEEACVDGIREVGCLTDCHFVDRTPHGDYLLVFHKIFSDEKGRSVMKDSQSDVYKAIRKLTETYLEKEKALKSFATFEYEFNAEETEFWQSS